MRRKSAANAQWESCGGNLDIPEGWFVCGTNFDAFDPWVKIASVETREEKTIPCPKPLAYYLSCHFCGSEDMRNNIREDGRREVQNAIKSALGL